MENHSSTLCSIVGGSSDLTKKQWKIDPPILAPESHDLHVAGRASDISCRRSNESHGKIYFPRSRSSRTKHKRQVFFKRVANCMEKNLCYTHPLLSERSCMYLCVWVPKTYQTWCPLGFLSILGGAHGVNMHMEQPTARQSQSSPGSGAASQSSPGSGAAFQRRFQDTPRRLQDARRRFQEGYLGPRRLQN